MTGTGRNTPDQHIRAAERAAYEHYGLDPRARVLTVDAGPAAVAVRVMELGAPAAGDNQQVPVVVLHGIGSPAVLFAPLLAELGELGERHVVVVDWPGHGLSGPLVLGSSDHPRSHAVATLRSLLDQLGLDVVDIVAHSLGGQFALYASLELGPRIRRLVLLGAPGAAFIGVQPIPVMKLAAVPGLGRVLLSIPLSDKAFVKSGETALGPGVVETFPKPLFDAAHLVGGRRANAASIAGFFRSLLKRGAVRDGVAIQPAELGRLTQPTLIVWGDRDTFLLPSAGQRSVDAIPDVSLRTLDAGHAPWLEHAQVVGDAVREFLGRPAAATGEPEQPQ